MGGRSVTESRKRTFRSEREFGFIVGGVLMLLGGWWLYRGKFHTVAVIFLGSGALLMMLGAIWPRGLVVPNRSWMALAHYLSLITTPIVLGIVYFLILTPIGVIKRSFGWDPLHRRAAKRHSYWHPYPERQRDPRHYEKMY